MNGSLILQSKAIPGLNYSVDSVDYEDKSGEELYSVEFLISL